MNNIQKVSRKNLIKSGNFEVFKVKFENVVCKIKQKLLKVVIENICFIE